MQHLTRCGRGLLIVVALGAVLACSMEEPAQAVPTSTPVVETSTPVVPTSTPTVEVADGLELVYNGSFIKGLEGWEVLRYNDEQVPQFEPKANTLAVTWLGGTGVSGVHQVIWFPNYSRAQKCTVGVQVLDDIYSDIFSTAVVVALTPERFDPALKQQAVFRHYGFGLVQRQVYVPAEQRTTNLFIGFDKTADEEFFTVELFNISVKCERFY